MNWRFVVECIVTNPQHILETSLRRSLSTRRSTLRLLDCRSGSACHSNSFGLLWKFETGWADRSKFYRPLLVKRTKNGPKIDSLVRKARKKESFEKLVSKRFLWITLIILNAWSSLITYFILNLHGQVRVVKSGHISISKCWAILKLTAR